MRTSAPSFTSICSKWRISSTLRARSPSFVSPYTRRMMGAVYQEPMKMPTLPFGGRARQKDHMGGRSRSSSVGPSSAKVRMYRGSIHALRRFMVSPLPAPSTPPMSKITGKRPAFARSYCASRRASRSLGDSSAKRSFEILWPSSADSNIGTRGYQERAIANPAHSGRPAALPSETDRATVSPSSRFRLAASATEHRWMSLNGRASRHSMRRRAAPREGVVPRLDPPSERPWGYNIARARRTRDCTAACASAWIAGASRSPGAMGSPATIATRVRGMPPTRCTWAGKVSSPKVACSPA